MQKIIVGGAFVVFLGIGVAGLVKSKKIVKEGSEQVADTEEVAVEPELVEEVVDEPAMSEEVLMREITPPAPPKLPVTSSTVDRIRNLFSTGQDKLPIVETITYRSRVDWINGRPAWIADYASHYKTSRHFIARSLNKKADYFTQKVSLGDKFNVLRTDIDVRFHLLVDLKNLVMNFYYVDPESGDYQILKTYPIAAGKIDENSPSGCTTPLGTYNLGEKVAIYKQGVEGFYLDEKIEMIQVFGTRWIPIDDGIGIHGVGWIPDADSGDYREEREHVGHYVGSGCIRMYHEDVEELFSIVITRPTTVEFVKEIAAIDEPQLEETGS